MSRYIIPKGWNTFDVKPSTEKYVLCMTSGGLISTIPSSEAVRPNYVCWRYPQPLEKDYFYITADNEQRCDIIVESEAITGVLLKSDFLSALNTAAGHDDEKIGEVMRRIANVLSEEYNEVMS